MSTAISALRTTERRSVSRARSFGWAARKASNSGLGEIPGIDVLARRRVGDGEGRLALVLQGGRDRPLVEPVERVEGAALRVGAARQSGADGERVAVALLLVDVLEDPADLEQLGHRDPLARRKVGERGREPDRLGLVEDRLDLRRVPFAGRRRLGGGGRGKSDGKGHRQQGEVHEVHDVRTKIFRSDPLSGPCRTRHAHAPTTP